MDQISADLTPRIFKYEMICVNFLQVRGTQQAKTLIQGKCSLASHLLDCS